MRFEPGTAFSSDFLPERVCGFQFTSDWGTNRMSMDFQPTAYVRMLSGRIMIGSTSATALRVGSSNLESRKWLLVQNASNQPIFLGSEYLSGTTPTTITAERLGKVGTKIAEGDMMWFPIADTLTLYARTNSGNGFVRIVELA